MTYTLRCVLAFAVMGAAMAAGAVDDDPYLWLSSIDGARALEWARQETTRTDAVLKVNPLYQRYRDQILTVLNAPDRIPEGTLDHQWVLNFWQGEDHVRGLWRRTTMGDFAQPLPHWQTLLDLDALDRDTHQNWVWAGADCTPSFQHCLLSLSPGGGDAVEMREYDPQAHRFIDEGFRLPVAKSTAMYLDEDTVLVATDFGPGSMTPSSYPRIVKLWHRGEPLSAAKTVYEAATTDMAAAPEVFRGPYGTLALIVRNVTFFKAEYRLVQSDGSTFKLPLPQDAQLQGVTQGQLIATLQDRWREQKIAAGALIAFPLQQFASTHNAPPISVLYTPGKRAMIDQVAAGRDAVYASIYEDVVGSIHTFEPMSTHWSDLRLALPSGGSTSIMSTNAWGPEALLTYQSFLTPPTLYAYDGTGAPRSIKAQPARFDASGLEARQYWTRSRDGTRVPYFLIRPRGARGPIPTILHAYGGFQLSLTPWYWNDAHHPLDAGETWLTHGGAIAIANIRGGGEFGPKWHQAALTYHRQRAFDDFEAVAADIERHQFSTPRQLGIVGASNGGLLVTAVMVQRPDLFGAVVCQRPLIDMLRYTHFGAGASWIEEYGDPADARMAAYIAGYSPYQNVRADAPYPPILFITETTDDRVTPVFARMMAAKMQAQGHRVFFGETSEGGHGAGATHAEEADYWALSYVFLSHELGLTAATSTH